MCVCSVIEVPTFTVYQLLLVVNQQTTAHDEYIDIRAVKHTLAFALFVCFCSPIYICVGKNTLTTFRSSLRRY